MKSKKDEDKPLEPMDHSYDGIQEYDHPLPRWWLTTFYMAIIFAAGYYAYFSLGPGESVYATFLREHRKMELVRRTQESQRILSTHAEILAAVKSPERSKQGKKIFNQRCLPCHGANGQGIIGPNLVDDYWIHGGQLTEIAMTLRNGVLEKGMPAWGPILSEVELQDLISFIRSLRGTKPEGLKPPQGVLVEIKDET
jgi:cytochrome c oxidase cbb3-type subunit III